MTPQIIYICLICINLIIYGYRHNKPRTGKYNLWTDLLALALGVGLVYWGGFFDNLFK